MYGPIVMLAVNIAVALVFAGGYAAIALSGQRQPTVLWFSGSYLLGAVAPVADVLIAAGAPAAPLEALGYTTFLIALLSIAIGFCIYTRRQPPWGEALAILGGGLILRIAIWSFRDGSFAYGIAYQMPFALASLLILRSVWVGSRGWPLHGPAVAISGLLFIHFLLKPFFYSILGGGGRLESYTETAYAAVSQAATGILMLVSGVVLMVVVAQRAIFESEAASETDALSGLANRRGFDRRACRALARAEATGARVSVVLFDLDHFKGINDRFGHETGDTVIARFAALLHDAAPAAAVVGRLGGEEFAMLLEGTGLEGARLHAEAIRVQTAEDEGDDRPAVTVSGGVAERRAGEALADLMRRADKATYRAKAAGRNAIHISAPPAPALRLVGNEPSGPSRV